MSAGRRDDLGLASTGHGHYAPTACHDNPIRLPRPGRLSASGHGRGVPRPGRPQPPDGRQPDTSTGRRPAAPAQDPRPPGAGARGSTHEDHPHPPPDRHGGGRRHPGRLRPHPHRRQRLGRVGHRRDRRRRPHGPHRPGRVLRGRRQGRRRRPHHDQLPDRRQQGVRHLRHHHHLGQDRHRPVRLRRLRLHRLRRQGGAGLQRHRHQRLGQGHRHHRRGAEDDRQVPLLLGWRQLPRCDEGNLLQPQRDQRLPDRRLRLLGPDGVRVLPGRRAEARQHLPQPVRRRATRSRSPAARPAT